MKQILAPRVASGNCGRLAVFAAVFVLATLADAAPMKMRVIQPPYARDPAKIGESLEWELEALSKCSGDLDVIVLPESSDCPGSTPTPDVFSNAVERFNAPFLAACSETAKRCNAVVFVNAVDMTPTGWRNTTFVYGRDGVLAGKYDKAHLTAGEWKRFGLDASYMWEWAEPKTIEIDGVRYAFMTCYDFYFYEAFSGIARKKPDVIIGCSLQRSDPHSVLESIGRYLAYNTGAYLVRASVSMGLDSPVGGSSMVVAPSGEMLGNLYSRVGSLTVEFDPKAKYLKPMGFGNPPGLHSDYIEIGRRPWRYRPAGSAVIPAFDNAPAKRLCAHRGFSTVAPENGMAAFGAAVALGASEIEFDLWWTKDGEIVSIHDPTLERVSNGTGKVYEHTYAELASLDFGVKKGPHFKGTRIVKFSEILAKFSQHTIMNIHVKDIGGEWDEEVLSKAIRLIDAYDARRHVYFMTSCEPLQDQLARLAPDIPRCMGNNGDNKSHPDIVDLAVAHKCKMVQLFKPYFDQSLIDRAHAAGLRVNVFWSDNPEEARRFLDMGIDTILTNDYQPISSAIGLR